MTRTVSILVSLLLVTSLLAVTGTAVAVEDDDDDSEVFAGTHLAFSVEGSAIASYELGGTETFSEVRVESQSEAAVDVGAGLDAVADIEGAGLSMSAEAETNAQIEAESGAELLAHDTKQGHLVVEAGGDDQVVEAELSAEASAEADGDAVVVENGQYEGAFVVAGEGSVEVNSEGDVVADLDGDATLVFRAYAAGERTDVTELEESQIADGTASVDLHVEQRADETVAEAVTFGQETSAEAHAEAEGTVEVAVERAVSEGTVVITTVERAVLDASSGLDVTIDGEVVTEAETQVDLLAAAQGGEPTFMIGQETEAEATVYVGVDHFSERQVEMQEADDGDDYDDGDDDGADDAEDDYADDHDDGDDYDDSADDHADDDTPSHDDADDDSIPGFGVVVALIALLSAAALAMRE